MQAVQVGHGRSSALRVLIFAAMATLAVGTFGAWWIAYAVPASALASSVPTRHAPTTKRIAIDSIRTATLHLTSGRSITIWLDRANAPESTRAFILSCDAGAFRGSALHFDGVSTVGFGWLGCSGGLHSAGALGRARADERENGVLARRGVAMLDIQCGEVLPTAYTISIIVADEPDRTGLGAAFGCVIDGVDELAARVVGLAEDEPFDCVAKVTLAE